MTLATYRIRAAATSSKKNNNKNSITKSTGGSSSGSSSATNSSTSSSSGSSSGGEDLTKYSSDYQAEINRRSAINPNDPTISQLNKLREQKKADISSGYLTTSGEPTWLTNAPSMGGTRDTSSNSYYDSYLRDQQKAIKARIESAVASNNAYIPQVNTQSDEALQNAYIAREQSRVNAPQAMAAMGYTGGAAESTLLGINTNYENSRNTIETNRQNALNDIYQNEQKIRSEGDATLADAASTYYQNLVEAQQQAQAAAQAQENWQAEYDLKEQQYADAAAQQAWQNAYNERMQQYELNKPYYKPTSGDSTSGSSGKSSSSGGSSGSTGSSSSTNKNTSGNYYTVLNNVQRALGGSNNANSTAWNQVINYVQNSIRQGLITEYEGTKIINGLGL